MAADPTPYSAEHDEPWPGGRSNHYLFDMNRDWFAQSQPETRGRIKIGLEFQPQITVDLHEQGGDNAYYFSPPAEAINPHVTKSQIAGWELLGRANAARFDERGWAYYIREVYDAFYPGYGDSWPTFQGSIGNTYEQASARGLTFARSDGDTLTYRDGVMHHFNAAIVTADHRGAESRAVDARIISSTAAARSPKARRARSANTCSCPDRTRRAPICWRAISRRRASRCAAPRSRSRLAARTIPAGAYLVSNAQPTARMIRNLLDPKTEQSAEFIKKQEERRKMRLNDQIYDITAWNLPMLFDVETGDEPVGDHRQDERPCRRSTTRRSRRVRCRRRKVGYLMPWGSAAVALSADAMRQGIRIRSVGGAFTQNGRRYPIGTAFIRNAGNPADLNAKLAALAVEARRRARADRFDVGRRRHVARQQRRRGAEDAEGAARVGHADAVAVGRLDALRARAPLRRRASPRFAPRSLGARQLQRLRRDRAAVRQLRRPDQRRACSIASRTGCARGGTLITLAEASRWATGSNVGLLDTTGLLERWSAGRASAHAGGSGRAGASGFHQRRSRASSITTRRSSPIASGRRRSPARSCA